MKDRRFRHEAGGVKRQRCGIPRMSTPFPEPDIIQWQRLESMNILLISEGMDLQIHTMFFFFFVCVVLISSMLHVDSDRGKTHLSSLSIFFAVGWDQSDRVRATSQLRSTSFLSEVTLW